MAINWKSKVFLAKIEAAYGADPTPTGAANAILATDIRLQPMEGQDVSRNLELPWLGAQSTIPEDLHAKLSFRVEMTPSGTRGTVPPWGVLLRGCGSAEVVSAGVSVVYGRAAGSLESVTFYLWIGATLYKLTGARGTVTVRVTASGVAYLEFEFTGLFVQPAETPQAVPVLSAQIARRPKVASAANTPVFTYNAVPLVMRSFSLALGNVVEPRFLVNSHSVVITDWAESIETTVEAVPLTTLNPFLLAADQTAAALALTHGTVAGSIVSLAMPAVQLQRPQSLENQQNIKEWPLRGVPLPVGGNDQWSMTLT